MIELGTNTNILQLTGLNQIKWFCYSHLLTLRELNLPNFNTNPIKEIPKVPIVEAYHIFLRDGVPCFLSVEKVASKPGLILLVMFVFWIGEPQNSLIKEFGLKEIRSGFLNSDTLQNLKASDLAFPPTNTTTLFSPLYETLNLEPNQMPEWEEPDISDLSELELLLFAIRNLVNRYGKDPFELRSLTKSLLKFLYYKSSDFHFVGLISSRYLITDGGILLGKLILMPWLGGDDGRGMIGPSYISSSFDTWLVNSNLYFKPTSNTRRFKSLAQISNLGSGQTVLLSPLGTRVTFLGFEKGLGDDVTTQLKTMWINKLKMPLHSLDREELTEAGDKIPTFCLVRTGGGQDGSKMIYPTSLVFIFIPEREFIDPEPSQISQSIKTSISQLVRNISLGKLDTENEASSLTKQKLDQMTSDSIPLKSNVKPILVDHISLTDVDEWFENLSKTAPPPILVTEPAIPDEPNPPMPIDFTSPANPLPGLMAPHLTGTDPTPPTDSDFLPDVDVSSRNGMDYQFDMGQFNNDFNMDDMDDFQVTDTDFSFFDREDAKPNSIPSAQLSSQPISINDINNSNVMVTPSSPKPSSMAQLKTGPDDPIELDTIPEYTPEIIESNQITHALSTNLSFTSKQKRPNLKRKPIPKKFTAKLISKDPWIPSQFSPIKEFHVDSGFLLNGKFSALSKELSSRAHKSNLFPFLKVTYRPNRYIRGRPPPKGLVEVKKIVSVNKSKASSKPRSKVGSSSEENTSSGSESSSDSGSESDQTEDLVNPELKTELNVFSNPVLFIPDLSHFWPRDATKSKSISPGISFDSIFEDPIVLRIFMDQIRTLPYPFVEHTTNSINVELFNLYPSLSLAAIHTSWSNLLTLTHSLNSIFIPTVPNPTKSILTLNAPLKLSNLTPPLPLKPTPASRTAPLTVLDPARIQCANQFGHTLDLQAQAAYFWPQLQLSPVNGRKDVRYLCIYPQGYGLVAEDIASFISSIRMAYTTSNLGSLDPLQLTHAHLGAYEIPTALNDKMSDISKLLGMDISNLPKVPDHVLVFYLYPSPLKGGDWVGSFRAKSVWDHSVGFRQMLGAIDRDKFSRSCQIHPQMISMDDIISYQSNTLPSSYYLKLTFGIYAKFHEFLTSDSDDINEDKTPSALFYCPPYYLSPPPPVQINFQMSSLDKPLLDRGSTLHVTYGYTRQKEFLIAVWIDDTGQTLDHCLLPVSPSARSDDAFLIDQLFQATKKFSSRNFPAPPRLAVTRLGFMGSFELETWKRFIDTMPGSCVLCTGLDRQIELYDPSPALSKCPNPPQALILTHLNLPIQRTLFAQAIGILNPTQLPAHRLEIFLLYNSFHIASPPLQLEPAFQRILTQLNNLTSLDLLNNEIFNSSSHPAQPRSQFPPYAIILPLPYRWVINVIIHLQAIKSNRSQPS